MVFILGLCCIDVGHNWSDDFALYVSQTQALWEGNTRDLLQANYFAMEHSYAHVGPYLYPSGFSILLLPIYAFWGLDLWVMKVYCLLFLVASIPLIYAIFKSAHCSNQQALSITALVAFNYHFIRFSDHVLSDLPFLFFSLFSFYHLQKQNFKNPGQAIFLGALIFFTYNIRDIGLMLLPSLFVYQWKYYQQQKQSSLFLLLLPYLTFTLAWFLRNYFSPAVPSKQLSLLSETSFEIIFNNLYYYTLLTGNYFLIFRGIPLNIKLLIASIFSLSILLGIYKKGKEQFPILLYIGLSIGVYLIWISFQGMRFWFPILPFLVYFVTEGIKAFPISLKLKRMVIYGLILSSLSQSLFISYYYWNTDTNEAYSIEMQKIYQYIQETTPKDALITFQKPRALRLFTHRNSMQKTIPEARYVLVNRLSTNMPSDSILLQTEHYTLLYKK